jgi:hypothetical protein
LPAARRLHGRWPRAQQKAMPVIGFLGSLAPDFSAPRVAAFREGLSETGFAFPGPSAFHQSQKRSFSTPTM